MAKDISLLGADYPDVPGVTLPQTGGGTATFWNIDDTTAAAGDVLSGKYFYDDDGVKTEGSISTGTVTNNTSGGTSSGTVNRGNQIKIGAGYYSADQYYTAQANSGTKTISSSGTISVDGYANVSVAAGSNTVNVTGGTPNISTINRGMQIKIGAGYHASDVYYTAQANSGTLTITQSGTTSCDGYANVSVPNDCVIINVTATSNTSTTISNSDITSDYYVFNTASSLPTADVSWATANGSVTLTCSGGIPAMTLFLCRKL